MERAQRWGATEYNHFDRSDELCAPYAVARSPQTHCLSPWTIVAGERCLPYLSDLSLIDADLVWHLCRYAITTVTQALSFIQATTSSVAHTARAVRACQRSASSVSAHGKHYLAFSSSAYIIEVVRTVQGSRGRVLSRAYRGRASRVCNFFWCPKISQAGLLFCPVWQVREQSKPPG